jgi:hypothetical protein
MIRSLYNLTRVINQHISAIPSNKDFNLTEIKPFLQKYVGTDWYDYKLKNSINSIYNDEFQRIPIYFKDLDNCKYDMYDMYLVLWRPFAQSSIKSHPEGGQLIKVLEGNLCSYNFINTEAFPVISLLEPNDIITTNDNTGLHRFGNNDFKYTYSLHIYSPAFSDVNTNKAITSINTGTLTSINTCTLTSVNTDTLTSINTDTLTSINTELMNVNTSTLTNNFFIRDYP